LQPFIADLAKNLLPVHTATSVGIVDPSVPPPVATAAAPERMRVNTRFTWRMKPSPSKSMKTVGGKKRSREEAAGSVGGSTPPVSPPRPNPNKEWKKSKAKTEDLLALLNSVFLREKEVDMWCATAGDPYPMEKNPDEIPMFTRFMERGLALPASNFFKGLLEYYGIEYLNLNPNGIFHTFVFVHFCEAFLGIKPHLVLFWKFFRVKPQPSANDPRVVGGPASRCARTPPSSTWHTS
jgi:hypothetical protein